MFGFRLNQFGCLLALLLSTTAPATAPSAAVCEIKSAGIRFNYPADWKPIKGATAIFDVADPGGPGRATLALDVPKVPHIPDLISVRMVEDGYVKDIRKNQIHDAKIDQSVQLFIPASSARRVKLSGTINGKPAFDVAVLIVHKEGVYIFSCDSDDIGYPAARAALDNAVASIEWIK